MRISDRSSDVCSSDLAPGITDALRPLLTDTAVLKVMHSPSEDLVAFMHACGVVPQPLFDTQAAAALSGIAAGIGYQRLVQLGRASCRERRVSVRVDLGGRRIIKQKNKQNKHRQ